MGFVWQQATWANTDTRLGPNVLFKENLNRQITISELGWGGSPKDILEYMEMAPEGIIAANIQQLKDLIRRQPIDHKRGPTEDKILKLLAYGDHQMPATKIKIGDIRQSLNDFAGKGKEGKIFSRLNSIQVGNGIKEFPPTTCDCGINQFRL